MSVMAKLCLHAELLEVVVDMFVHPHGPLVGGEVAEEAVGVGGTAGGAGGGEAVDQGAEDVARVIEIAVVRYGKAGDRGRVAPHRLALLEGFGFDHSPDQAADEHSRRTAIAEGKFHSHGAVGDGLTGRHFAPETPSVGTEAGDAIFEFLNTVGVPEIFHGFLPVTRG